MGLKDIQNIILVLSGKGGVGKSSVAAHLALTLRDLDFKVGILDVDLCGPSIPYLLGLEGKDVHQCPEGWVPVFADKNKSLAVMSLGFLLNNRNDAVIWRGPKKNDIQNIILVLSGKGGVGKSSVAAHLALTLRDLDFKVGILDVDLCGPSIPYLLGLEGKDVHQCPEGWVPVFADKNKSLAVMSLGFLLNNRNDAVIWRGPKKNAMIKQFLNDVHWEALDYLVIDMPPGTTDEHITIAECLKKEANVGAVLVTTPQMIAINDVMREITFCKKASLQIIGIIENMSGFVCPNCKECSAIFSQGGGQSLAEKSNLTFLGSIPLDPQFAASIKDRCEKTDGNTQSQKNFQEITKTVVHKMKGNE